MAILVLADEKTEAGKRVQETVASTVAGYPLVNCRSVFELAIQLRKPGGLGFMAVILAGSPSELDELVNIRHLLDNVRTILILPDGRPESVSKGHMLCPRFLSYADTDLSSVGAVLAHMLERESKVLKLRGFDQQQS
jgi:hypothetical protein